MDHPPGVGVVEAGIDRMPHEVAILDADGTIVVVNEMWRRFADTNHGVHPDYWVGENYFEVCEAADDSLAAIDLVAGLQEVLAGERDQYQYEYPCHSPSEQRWFRLDAVPFDHDGESYLLISHTNITDRMLAELRANARTEQLETVIDVLMHDLRNPLNIIDGYVELLADELDHDHIETIQQAVIRVTEITEATLAFSESGMLSEIEPLPIAELARTAWQSVATGEATLALGDSQRIIGDRRLLLQLFENLYRNAIEHAGPACTVTVGGCEGGFYVADDGPGIPEPVREKAVKADYSTQGTGGLGLAIVQSVVRAHGGQLTITDATGGGARFELTGFDIPPDSTRSS